MQAKLILGVAIAVVAGCKGGKSSGEVFGKTVLPPHGLDKLHRGMTLEEAKAAVPGLEPDSMQKNKLVVDSGSESVKLGVRLDHDRVESITAMIQGTDGEELLTKAWGAPEHIEKLGEKVAIWRSTATGWQADVSCLTRTCHVHFTPYKPLTPEFFGKAVAPPGPLGKLKIGMTKEQAAAAAPVMAVDGLVDADADGVMMSVRYQHDTKLVSGMYLTVPRTAQELLAKAWGPGKHAVDTIKRPLLVWHDPATGWRATLEDEIASTDHVMLDFTTYTPAEKVLGPGTELAVLPKSPVGMTVDEVKQAYPAAKADATGVVLELPPTEWADYTTRLSFFITDGKVQRVWIPFAYGKYPAAKDEILALMKKKWGEPKSVQDLGTTKLVFHDASPQITVEDDAIMQEVRIEQR